jgi:hypothetical protein
MRTIHKYRLQVPDDIREASLIMPQGARMLSVQEQQNRIMLWAEVDTERPPATYRFSIYGTGHPIDEDNPGRYIGTVLQMGGNLVWHIFDLGEVEDAPEVETEDMFEDKLPSGPASYEQQAGRAKR